MARQEELVFLPLGGVGEIGMNLALYGYGTPGKRQWIMVDCGVTFAGPELPGVDLILPDIRFLAKERENLKAIIITHAHEDHYGALNDLWPGLNVPVYASGFTAGMLEAKRNYEGTRADIPVTPFKAGDRISIGPFDVEAVAVNHSIPEPMSLVIRTPLGNVVHTGDWKIDQAPSLGPMTDESRFRAIGDEGVLALMCDSTNPNRDGVSPSEEEVSHGLRKIIEDAEGITLRADLPGVDRENLNIAVEGETLTIEGTVDLGESNSIQPIYSEIRVAQYRRSFVLGRDLDANRIEAAMRDGVLTLRIPKAERAKPRRIEVKAS